MIWWHVVDGVARGLPDSPAVRAFVDRHSRDIYGTIEGAILHGGVLATAFKRTTERTYDAARWLETGEHVPVGFVTITEITACPSGAEGVVSSFHHE
jgi:hypothetical protein